MNDNFQATCTVEVEVADVNDNDPVFGRSYSATVSEGASNNTRLQLVSKRKTAGLFTFFSLLSLISCLY